MTAGIVPRRGLAQYGLFLDLHTACAMEYRPARRVPGPAVVVRLTGPDSIAPRAPRDLGWSDWVTGPITVVELAGTHLDMLRAPCVLEVGARIREALEPLG
jgi:thioesterase domain-containing protein